MPLIFWNYLLTLHHNKKCNLILCSVIVFLLINCLILKVFRSTTDFLHKKSTPSSPYCNISLNISLFIELKQFISPFSLFFLIFVFWGCFFFTFFFKRRINIFFKSTNFKVNFTYVPLKTAFHLLIPPKLCKFSRILCKILSFNREMFVRQRAKTLSNNSSSTSFILVWLYSLTKLIFSLKFLLITSF